MYNFVKNKNITTVINYNNNKSNITKISIIKRVITGTTIVFLKEQHQSEEW